jgi:hypothetical protein
MKPGQRRSEGTGPDVCRVGHHTSWMAGAAVIEAMAPSLPILFDESGMALADLTAEAESGAPASIWEPVDLEAADLASLASTWLNDLMCKACQHRAELVDVAVDTVAGPADETRDRWRLHGRVGLRRLYGRHGPAPHDLWATTSPRIRATGGTWTLHADLDPTPPEPSALDEAPQPGQARSESDLRSSSARPSHDAGRR